MMTIQDKNVFFWPIRIYYEDTDAGGVVYHTNHLKFMERARTEWLRELGFEQDELREKYAVIFAVHSAQIYYFSPAIFNDELMVSSQVIKKGKASITIEQKIIRHSQDVEKKTDILCKGIIKVVMVDSHFFKPKAMPETLYEIINISNKG